jgi:uncharacterized protein
MARVESIRVSVAYSPQARVVDETELSLPAGATLADAIRASGVLDRHPGLDLAHAKLGIWGRVQAPQTVLRERDRVEVYRPLQVDPKEARRLRYRKVSPAKRSR